MPSDAVEPPSISHNDLYDAFEAGYMEGWQYNGGEVGYIRGAFEDWFRNRESISDVFNQERYCDMCDQTTHPEPTKRGDICSNCSCYYEPPGDPAS